MKILFFGDIVASIGRAGVSKILPELKKEFDPDIVIANGENLSHGSGISIKNYNEMLDLGIEFFTSGNHIWRRKEIFPILDDPSGKIIRPANYPDGVPGVGYKQLTIAKNTLLMVNLQGQVFMTENLSSPFKAIDDILESKNNNSYDAIVVDFHAETTSEKMAMFHHLDGRVTALLGTHTHIPTADCEISAKGTAKITDVGGCYAKESVIGVDKDIILKRFIEQIPYGFDYPESGECIINCIYLEIKNNIAKELKHIQKVVNIV